MQYLCPKNGQCSSGCFLWYYLCGFSLLLAPWLRREKEALVPLPIEFWDGHTKFFCVLSFRSPDFGRRQRKISPPAFTMQRTSMLCLRRSTEAAGSRSTAVFGNKKHNSGVRKAVGSVLRAGGLLGKGYECSVWPYSDFYVWMQSHPQAFGLTNCTSTANCRGWGWRLAADPCAFHILFPLQLFSGLQGSSGSAGATATTGVKET